MATVIPLFAVPLYTDNIGTDYDLEFLKNVSLYERMESNNGFYSKDKFILEDPRLKSLKDMIQEHINAFVGYLSISNDAEFYITNSWVVKHIKGDWGPSHYHGNSVISGVYYFDVDPSSGDIVFENRQDNLFGKTLEFDFKEWNIFNSYEWSITPENGNIVLFPSHLSHRIKPSQSDLRYCLPFNVFVRGKMGSSSLVSTLEIK
jgi:uncharacterized protein (TIGR02466 family)